MAIGEPRPAFFFKYNETPPYDHPVYTTTSLLRPNAFDPSLKITKSFNYFEDPVNANTSLLRPEFNGPTVVSFQNEVLLSKLLRKSLGGLVREHGL